MKTSNRASLLSGFIPALVIQELHKLQREPFTLPHK